MLICIICRILEIATHYFSIPEAKGTGKVFFYCPLGFLEYYTVLDDSIPTPKKSDMMESQFMSISGWKELMQIS